MPNWQEREVKKMKIWPGLELQLTKLGYTKEQIDLLSIDEALKLAG